MIKFFRRVRQKMLTENKVNKYLLYAIGEIILVVIGILIALQINTWNESRKAANEEIKILKALELDFNVSKKRIEETISLQSIVMNYSQILIKIHEKQTEKDFQYFDTHLDSLSNLIIYGTSWYRAEPVTGAYNSLINAGKIDLIQDEKLRHLLAQFMADFESGFEDQETTMHLLNILNSQIDSFILKITNNTFRNHYGYGIRQNDTIKIAKSFFTNDSFFGSLFLKSIVENNRLDRQKKMRDQISSILITIKKELEEKSK